jgi:RimJ/RimL family protein N-acetyltransferase
MDGAIALSACQQVSRHPFVPILWGVGGSCHTLSIPQKPLSQLSVGLFLTAPVLMSGLEDAVAALYSTIRPARVVVRPHPIAMFTPNLDDLVSRFPGLHISQGESLESSIEQCDIVIAGDSNVHREVLRAGVPSLYLASLDGIARDYWKFVAHRVTMEVDLTSFSLEQLRQFHDESWTDRFRAYDASYLESLSETNARVKGEIESFLTEFESSDHVGTITTPQRTTGEPLKEDSLKLRAATRSDSAMLLKWRNEETVRRNSSNSAEISEEDHARWFERVMNSPLTKIYILERGTTPVGSIRFALNEGVATVSYSIDKLYRGQGLGRFIVREGVRRTITDLGQPVTIRAVVKPDNTPSLAVLRKVGFTVQRSDPSGSLVLEKA